MIVLPWINQGQYENLGADKPVGLWIHLSLQLLQTLDQLYLSLVWHYPIERKSTWLHVWATLNEWLVLFVQCEWNAYMTTYDKKFLIGLIG